MAKKKSKKILQFEKELKISLLLTLINLDIATDICFDSIQSLDPQLYSEIFGQVMLEDLNDALTDHLIATGIKNSLLNT